MDIAFIKNGFSDASLVHGLKEKLKPKIPIIYNYVRDLGKIGRKIEHVEGGHVPGPVRLVI